jgi:peptide/nickel transport system substrate-binding protein
VTLINNSIDIQSVARRVASDAIPTADNRWTGTNRGGYASAQWDDLATHVMAALDEPTRLDFERRMLQLYTTELPLLPLMYTLEEVPVGGGLTGVAAYTGVPRSATILLTWNIHEWDVARS